MTTIHACTMPPAITTGPVTDLSNPPKPSPANAAGPGGDHAPSGSGRAQHDWTDWLRVADPDVEEALSERTCLACGSDQIVPTDSLLPVALLGRRGAPSRGEAA